MSIGLPQRRCSGLGRSERMRLPSPAARTIAEQRTVHAFHAQFLAAGDPNRTSTAWGTPSTLRRWPSLAMRSGTAARHASRSMRASPPRCAPVSGARSPGDLAQVDALVPPLVRPGRGSTRWARRWRSGEGRTPDGADATAWGRRWLETGLGGTCWAQSVAFASLLAAGGAETWITLERMVRFDVVDFHCAVVIGDGPRRLVYDLIHATDWRPAAGRRCHDRSGAARGVARTTGRALVPPVQARRAPVRLPPALDPPRPRRTSRRSWPCAGRGAQSAAAYPRPLLRRGRIPVRLRAPRRKLPPRRPRRASRRVEVETWVDATLAVEDRAVQPTDPGAGSRPAAGTPRRSTLLERSGLVSHVGRGSACSPGRQLGERARTSIDGSKDRCPASWTTPDRDHHGTRRASSSGTSPTIADSLVRRGPHYLWAPHGFSRSRSAASACARRSTSKMLKRTRFQRRAAGK